MSKFLTYLDVRDVEDNSNDGRGTWLLLADLVYQSDVAGITITAPEGLLTDFASVPKFPPIAFALCGDIGHPAAVIHDAVYTSQPVSREIADSVLLEALQVCGVPKWKAWSMWAAVRAAGASHWKAPGQVQAPEVQAALDAASMAGPAASPAEAAPR